VKSPYFLTKAQSNGLFFRIGAAGGVPPRSKLAAGRKYQNLGHNHLKKFDFSAQLARLDQCCGRFLTVTVRPAPAERAVPCDDSR
jgi:hypothetical protein